MNRSPHTPRYVRKTAKPRVADDRRRCMQKKSDMRLSFFSPSSRFYCNSCEFSCPDSGWAFYSIHALIWLNLIYYVIYFFTTLFICVPQRKMWMPDIPGRCFSLAAVVISAAFINVVSDVLMFLIPLFCISSLKMSKSHKIGISAVFAIGLL